jgi:hypothetical protein
MASAPHQSCPNCHAPVPPGALYCPTCGEAVDPALVVDLRALYDLLRDLDARIAAGRANSTVTELRDEYRERYLRERSVASPTPAQLAEQQWLYRALLDLDGRIAAGQGAKPLGELRDEYVARYTALRRAPPAAPGAATAPPTSPGGSIQSAFPYAATLGSRPATPAAPAGPAFSWGAFLQEQAISIMAYLGGFLVIIATLTFIITSWQALDDGIKLAVVIGVNALFLGLGIAFRRAAHLRTVGRAYLAVFALMTPLVALAVYRFALQGLDLPATGVLAITAFYAAIVYLALAWQTQLPTYGYLGWAALLIAVLATAGWIGSASGGNVAWDVFLLASYSLALLLPAQLRRFARATALATPALYSSAIGFLLAAIAALALGFGLWIARELGTTQSIDNQLNALLASAGVLVLTALGWSLTLRAQPDAVPAESRGVALTLADGSVGATLAFAAFSLALWLGTPRVEMAYLFAGLGLAELGAALAVRALQPDRRPLRVALGCLTFALAGFGALMVVVDATPNWPLMACLAVGIAGGVALTWMERQPWWELAAGVFLLAEFPLLVDLLRRTTVIELLYAVRPELVLTSFFFALLAVALWGVTLALAGRERLRAYTVPLYVVALGAAVVATLALPFGAAAGDLRIDPQADYQTAVLAIFAVLGLLAGARERQPVLAILSASFFGLLLPLPYALQNSTQGVPLSLVALGTALAALGLRRLLGRGWSYAAYGVALWATVVAAAHAAAPSVDTASWQALGISFAAALLLAIAALATVAAVWDAHPAVMAAPAVLALIALLATPSAIAQTALVAAFVAVAVTLRAVRGRFWNVAWLAAALLGSIVSTIGLGDPAVAGPWYQVGALLGLAVLAYAVAAQERAAWLTALAAVYSIIALLVMPGPDNLYPTVAVTLGAGLAGIAMRVLLTRGPARFLRGAVPRQTPAIAWTAAWYAVAGAGSIETVLRSGVSSDYLPIALLALAALAYLVAAVERTPWITPLAAIYGLWAALVIPGPHPLIPTVALAIGAGLVGAAVRQFVGRSWALALYAIGVGASLFSLFRVVPFDTNTLEVVLLIYTVVACVVVAIEREPLAGLAPAIYGSGAVLIQSDARLLLPIALGFGLVGMALGRRLDLRWALPWYIVTAVAGLATSIRGLSDAGFEPLALLALALLGYAIAAVERLPELLPVPLITGMLALLSAASYFQLPGWQTVLAFVALSYIYTAAQQGWRVLPGLDPRTPAPAATGGSASPIAPMAPGAPTAPGMMRFAPVQPMRPAPVPRDPRALGVAMHRGISLALAGVTALVAIFTPDSFTPQAIQTQVVAGALVGLAGLLALQAQLAGERSLLYLAGAALSLAVTWEVRWLGVDNVQGYVLAPGSYLLLVGALLPHDKKLRSGVSLGPLASALGAFTLLMPTFVQTFTAGQELVYIGALIVESLLVVGVGVGTRARTPLLLGGAFVGIAALRAALLAVGQGVPVFLVIAAVAALLLAGATWLSLRTRRPTAPGPEPGAAEKVAATASQRSANP